MKLFVVVSVMILLAGVCALPAADNLLDKATVYDVAANELSPTKIGSDEQKNGTPVPVESNVTPSVDGGLPGKPKPPGTMFARLIDDIFQIPIVVLQTVAKLLTNPFKQPETETSSTSLT